MIEFYYNFFERNYKAKIIQLIYDVKKLLFLENIKINQNYKIILNRKYAKNLSNESWKELNQLFFTLESNKEKLSKTLLKFINKNKVNKKFTFIDTFAGCGGLSLGLENAGF